MKKQFHSAFTLIELLVVITIIFIMSVVVYAPYQYAQTKQKVRNSSKIVSQTLYEARNLAINGVETSSGNVSIGAFFGSGSEKIILYNYLHSEIFPVYNDLKAEVYKSHEIKLEPGVEITGADHFFFYQSISGSGTYYKDGLLENNDLELNVGFRGASSGNLTARIKYYYRTYVTDRG